jgi:hypothetical protein
MKVPQFRMCTLLLLTAIMGGLFLACAKWPMTEPSKAPSLSAFVPEGQARGFRGFVETKRPPTPKEWSIRAGIGSGIVLTCFIFVGVWRARKSRAVSG